jgi:hypothetical protein
VQFAGSDQVIRPTVSKNHTVSAVVSDVGQTGNAPVFTDNLMQVGLSGDNTRFPGPVLFLEFGYIKTVYLLFDSWHRICVNTAYIPKAG